MKHVWAPWRMAYIEDDSETDVCIFCRALSQPDGPDNLILHRGRHAFIMLNRFPYTSGHVMVVPMAHEPSTDRLDDDTLLELMHLSNLALSHIRQAYQTNDFNLGINIGRAAGAGIVDHVHIHVVPRWNGDTNFMSTTSDTRVLPESLEETYARLSQGWS
jgi:ATP adenylyltransferase